MRPAVVLSSEEYQTFHHRVIIAVLTLRVAHGRGPFDYLLVNWAEAGLRFPSALRPVIATIDASGVLHHLGSLASPDLEAIGGKVRAALGL